MKKFLFTALAIAAFSATQASAMSYHDNDIEFSSDLHVISYEITASCVTDGQDPNGDLNPGKFAIVDGDDTFMLHCGRHNSSQVGDWIKAHATYGESILTLKRDNFPDKANFATLGTMKLEYNGTLYTFDNVLFAQYGSIEGNLWIISQAGARDLGMLKASLVGHKCAMIYGHNRVLQGNNVVEERLSLPLCTESISSYRFWDDADELIEHGYSPIEEVLNLGYAPV